MNQESVVRSMVDCPIFETHMHYWDVGKFSYPWHRMESELLDRNCLPDDFDEATHGYNVRKILVIEAGCIPEQVEDELHWLAGLQRQEPRIAGIITRFDLDRGAAFAAELDQARRIPLICGGRTVLQAYPDPAFCQSAEFLQSALLLQGTGYTLEIGMDYRHNRGVYAFLMQLDGRVPCVIDHLGYPDLLGGDAEQWVEEFGRLAEFDNVSCKISSLTARLGERWESEQIRPFAVRALQRFGPERVMFGSDWPTILKNASYGAAVEMTADFAAEAGFTPAQTKQLFMTNAERILGR